MGTKRLAKLEKENAILKAELKACSASFSHREKGWCPHCSYERALKGEIHGEEGQGTAADSSEGTS